jgi:tetratricopeptide (TPR) repeat protein
VCEQHCGGDQAPQSDGGARPSDPRFSVVLQAAGRHAEALERFEAAQNSPGNDSAPFLHAAVSYLAIGDNRAALVARAKPAGAPKLAAGHYAYGQAWSALGEAKRAEQAFSAAIQLSPGWADTWVNSGVARYSPGCDEGAKTAMRPALAAEPNHATAVIDLGASCGSAGIGRRGSTSERGRRARTERCRSVAQFGGRSSAGRAGCRGDGLLDAAAAPSDGRYCVIGDSSKPWPCCSSAAGRKREPFSMSLMRWGRFHWRLRLSCARGLCCWRSRKATQHAHQLNQRERSERPQKWAGRRFQSTRPWRASTSPKFGPDEARRAARSRIGLRPINCSRGSGHFRAIGTALLLTPIEAFSAARLNEGVRATNRDLAPVVIVGMPCFGNTLVE